MELGIIGLPTSGKTTIFNALTQSNRPTAAATTGKLELFNMITDVPDARVDVLSKMYQPRKTTYAKVAYTDIAGLDKDLAKKGLSGELRNKIAPMDAFVHVVRAFESPQVPHLAGRVDAQRDLNTLDSEFILADMLTIENRLERIAEGLQKGARGAERQTLQKSQALFERFRDALNETIPLRDLDLTAAEKTSVRGYSLLTLKPVLVLINTGEEPVDPTILSGSASLVTYAHQDSIVLTIQGQLEMEISQLAPDEAAMFMAEFDIQDSARQRVLQASFQLVNLHSFFTVGEDEVRAWNIPVGANAVAAAGTIHSDLARGFIRAEVTHYTDLIAAGDMTATRKAGKVRLEGKNYIVQDGDIVHIRFSI